MSNLIRNLRIQNFKSIKDLSLECERINVFIGKPNAGKSNILEAVSLLGINSFDNNNSNKFAEGIIRYRSLNHLFSNFNFRNPIEISVDNEKVAVIEKPFLIIKEEFEYDFVFSISSISHSLEEIHKKKFPYIEMLLTSEGFIMKTSTEPEYTGVYIPTIVKRYEFSGLIETTNNGFYLKPPCGDNFYSIVESHPELRKEITQFFRPNGLELLLDIENQRMSVVQKGKDNFLSFPLPLLPDTFQRYIFHLAAILSNRDSVLLFEEPESHSYGPYIYQLSQRIIDDEGGNQFFLTTHNPYFLLPLMREGKDVAVFTTWFENYETHAKRLTEEEIQEILDYGIDLFYNLDSFIPG